jgi:8-amino-7-oxononanoate synthase
VLPQLRDSLRSELSALEAADRLRRLPFMEGSSRIHGLHSGHPVISFSSNDYLGLADHPDLLNAAAEASGRSGFGAAASRLVSGDLPEHRALEIALADYLRRPSALLFPTGYQANIGVVATLAGPGDLIVSDAYNHASLIDGCRLSRATVRVFPHADPAAARAALTAPGDSPFRRRFLITESLFSMDGDLAPLDRYAEIAADTATALVVDEAHALGVLGPDGRGWAAQLGIEPDVLIGTLGKAFGSLGGFVTGAPELRSILENRARSFLFTTAAPPSLLAAALAALRIIDSATGSQRRRLLADNITHLRDRLAPLTPSTPRPPLPTPIVPFILGADGAALAISRALLAEGHFVQAIRPPTVPEGTARLRITLSATHTESEVDALAGALFRHAGSLR